MSSDCREARTSAGLVLIAALALAACKREDREFRTSPLAREQPEEITMVSIAPGPPCSLVTRLRKVRPRTTSPANTL